MPTLRLLELESRAVPATITVTSLADAGPGTLRAALAEADTRPGNDTIVFKLPAPPAHGENVITLASTLTSKGGVTIKGPGAGKLIVSGNNAVQVFAIADGSPTTDSPAALSGLSVVSGHTGGSGGGIYSSESLSLTGVVLSGNSAGFGGAVYVDGASGARTVTVTRSQVLDNSAQGNAAGLGLAGLTAVKVSNSTISANTAGNSAFGGGVYATLDGTGTGITVAGCAVTGNSAGIGGGMFLTNSSAAATAETVVTGCTVSGNASTYVGGIPFGGGGLFLAGGSQVVGGCTVSNNTATYSGGGMAALDFASLTITASAVTGNRTTSALGFGGGGLLVHGNGAAPLAPARISGCTVSDNSSAEAGGGALVQSGVKLTVTGSTFAGDRAASDGGGLMTIGTGAERVAVSVAGCTFADDQAGQSGGGLMVTGDGTAAVVATKMTGCSAATGGGVYANSSAAADGFVLTGCTLAGNTATGGSGAGGGLAVVGTPDFHVSGSSVTGNAAANGGGVYLENSSGSILGTTITGNAATGSGGGVFMQMGGPVTLQVARVRWNTAPIGPDVEGTFTFV